MSVDMTVMLCVTGVNTVIAWLRDSTKWRLISVESRDIRAEKFLFIWICLKNLIYFCCLSPHFGVTCYLKHSPSSALRKWTLFIVMRFSCATRTLNLSRVFLRVCVFCVVSVLVTYNVVLLVTETTTAAAATTKQQQQQQQNNSSSNNNKTTTTTAATKQNKTTTTSGAVCV